VLPTSLLLASAACGSASAPVTFDAPPPPDAAPIDAPARGMVTMHVSQVFGVEPVEGVHVLFLEADGSVAADEVTDADGDVAAEVGPGASVVLLFDAEGSHLAVYHLGVDPGAALAFGGLFGGATPSIELTYPAVGGATNYQISGGCGGLTNVNGSSAGTSATLSTSGCEVGEEATIFVRASNVGGLIGTLTATTTLEANTSITGTYRAPQTLDLTVTGIPAVVSEAAIDTAIRKGGVNLSGISASQAPIAGEATASGDVDRVLDSSLATFVGLTRPGFDRQVVLDTRAYDAGAAEVELVALLPWVMGAEVDAETGTVVWNEVGAGEPDVTFAFISHELGKVTSSALVYARHDGTEITLPALPAEYATFSPIDSTIIEAGVILYDLPDDQVDALLANVIKGYFGALSPTTITPDEGQLGISITSAL
jgi:hypothetical protein